MLTLSQQEQQEQQDLRDIRFQCLQLALQHGGEYGDDSGAAQIVEIAEAFYQFIVETGS